MPPFFDASQLHTAISARALPALERLAANPNRLDHSLNHRFESDDPPPYESSSESEGEEALYHPVLARSREAVFDEYKDVINEPLNDAELRRVAATLRDLYDPGARFSSEARREEGLLDNFFRSRDSNPHAKEFLKGRSGHQRRAVIVRRNIRKRWQRLGIWNPEWGIPGRVSKQPSDNTRSWVWKWQSAETLPITDANHPVNRAVQLRKGLCNGEHVPPPPRPHLRDDASASEAESFIISRPWFLLAVERMEFSERTFRIPHHQRNWRPPPDEEDGQVTKWWKQRGDWEKDWEVPGDRRRPVPGWKWRHESPSPEPEDLTLLNTDEMEFTPSEVDALESIPPDTPSRPRHVHDTTDKPFMIRDSNGVLQPLFPRSEPANPPPEEPEADAGGIDEPEEELVETERETPIPVPRRRGPAPKAQQLGEVAPPPVRRSGRIAARNDNPPPSPPARETRIRAAKAAATATAAEAPKKRGRPKKTQDEALKSRARPRKTQGAVSKAVTPPRKSGRKPNSAKTAAAAAAATTALDEGAASVPAAAKERRGRPRRTQ